jgi:hypothetical protein
MSVPFVDGDHGALLKERAFVLAVVVAAEREQPSGVGDCGEGSGAAPIAAVVSREALQTLVCGPSFEEILKLDVEVAHGAHRGTR